MVQRDMKYLDMQIFEIGNKRYEVQIFELKEIPLFSTYNGESVFIGDILQKGDSMIRFIGLDNPYTDEDGRDVDLKTFDVFKGDKFVYEELESIRGVVWCYDTKSFIKAKWKIDFEEKQKQEEIKLAKSLIKKHNIKL